MGSYVKITRPDSSVAPIRRDSLGMQKRRSLWSSELRVYGGATLTLRDCIRIVASWTLLLALSIDLLALLTEPVFLARDGAPARAVLAGTLAAFGLALFFAFAAAVPLASVLVLVRYIGRKKGRIRFLWPLPLVVVAWVGVLVLAPHKVIHATSVVVGQLALAALFFASLVAATALTRVRQGRIRMALGLAVTGAALAVSAAMPAVLTREPRDLLWLATVLFFAAIFYPLRREVVRWPHPRVSAALAVLVAGSIASLIAAPLLAPDWRTYASADGRFAPRLARLERMLIDLDGDGFSPVAWGTDCDDFRSARNPAARELADGRDHNCNGKTRPATPTPAERGLAPAAGSPDAAAGEVDRVVIITIDCLRNDALTAAYMPNLMKLAERGVRFEKLYASGARTSMSLPFLLRGSAEAPTIAEVLAGEGGTSTAVFGYRHATLEANVFDGFQRVERPDVVDRRIRAPELTDLALEDLRDPAHARKHLLWVHYFDAHAPRTQRVLPPDVPRFAPLVGEPDEESALYLAELYFVDRHVGRLIDGLAQLGGEAGLGRTVLVVTSDHGEGFGRHGVFEHGVSAFEAITHVPGILVAPSLAPAIYPHVTAQRDIAATALGAFGLVAKHPEIETFGRSWLRLRAAPRAALHEFAFTYETTTPFEHWGDAPMASIADDRAKLSVSYVDGITRFYRLDEDPNEDVELALRRPADVARYRDALETFRDLDPPPH